LAGEEYVRRRAILAAFLALGLAGCVGTRGNDSGGIIVWSPEAEANALDIAQRNCAQSNQYAVITSVHRQYGDYIGYRCQFEPRRHVRPISQLR
jgi:hypothetical protein